MFLDNRYAKIYLALMTRAQEQKRQKTFKHHSHHILPRSLGGSNAKENKVLLTVKEHYLAHCLLVKMTTGDDRNRMISAHCLLATATGRQSIFKRKSYFAPRDLSRLRQRSSTRAIDSIPKAPITPLFEKTAYRRNCLGKVSVTDGTKNRFVFPDELETLAQKGWVRGGVKRKYKSRVQVLPRHRDAFTEL